MNTISWAIEKMHEGRYVFRESRQHEGHLAFATGHTQIVRKTADGHVPWQPTHDDVVANDWLLSADTAPAIPLDDVLVPSQGQFRREPQPRDVNAKAQATENTIYAEQRAKQAQFQKEIERSRSAQGIDHPIGRTGATGPSKPL